MFALMIMGLILSSSGINRDWNLLLQSGGNAKAQITNADCEKNPGPVGGVDTLKRSGTISEDGRIFTDECDGKTWSIANLAKAKNHMGQTVTVNATFDSKTNEMRIKSLRVLSATGNGNKKAEKANKKK
jgi:hypothetical protein